jgi:hypothetical protein
VLKKLEIIGGEFMAHISGYGRENLLETDSRVIAMLLKPE